MSSEEFEGVAGLDKTGLDKTGPDKTGPGEAGLDDEVTAYAAEVRAELADLPAEAGAELLEDLEDHLREVAAEDAGALRERLGAPADYARELRQAAGLPGPGEGAAAVAASPGRWRTVRQSADAVARGVVRRLRSTDAGRQVLDFLPTLRPAWWVFRAWVLVRALEVWTGYGDAWHQYALIPKVHDSRTIGFVALAVAIPVSVYIGRHGVRGRWQRRLVIAGEAALGLFAFAIVVNGLAHANRDSGGVRPVAYSDGFVVQPGLSENGVPIKNLYVYDKNGKLVDGALVYDQDGRPVSVARPGESEGGEFGADLWVDADGRPVANRYPRMLTRPQWDGPGSITDVVIPPPVVNPPQGVHRLTDDLRRPSSGTPTGPTASGPTPSGPTPSASPANPDSPAPSPDVSSPPATPATATPGGATPAPGSSASSVPPPTPANPGAGG